MLYETSRSGRQRYLYVGMSKNLTFGDHLHSSFEFIQVTAGELEAVLSGKNYTLHSGDCMLILPHRAHRFRSPRGSENLTVIFSPDYVEEFARAARTFEFERPVFTLPEGRFLRPENLDPNPSQPYGNMAQLYGICAAAYAACSPRQPDKAARDDTLVQKIADYIDENCLDPITLQSLSVALGYNYCYLSDLIGRNFGAGFPALLASARIERAIHLMRTTRQSVTEIAGACGFSGLRSFHRAFRSVLGCSPREFLGRSREKRGDSVGDR